MSIVIPSLQICGVLCHVFSEVSWKVDEWTDCDKTLTLTISLFLSRLSQDCTASQEQHRTTISKNNTQRATTTVKKEVAL